MDNNCVIQRDVKDNLPNYEPFGGLFNKKIQRAVLEEIVADPHHEYRPKDISELLGITYNSIRSTMTTLTKIEVLEKDDRDPTRPKYKPNLSSPILKSLSFLLDALNDTRDFSDTMDKSIERYCTYDLGINNNSPPLTQLNIQQNNTVIFNSTSVEVKNFVLKDEGGITS
ncbi:MAG: hypothetical protein U9R75_10395 [Candidatus Thermoplasmatota archaeon]|nr:hypothetical protein [Candidatus Thermoplasmatota archaeon]